MRENSVLYFCNCYLIMLDYDKTIDEVIIDFINNEPKQTIDELYNECNVILNANKGIQENEVQKIISNANDLDIDTDELIDILRIILLTCTM